MPKRHLTEDDTDNEEGEEFIGRRKSRRRTWLGARHLALNAEGQLQLQQLNSQYDSILASHSLLSTQTVMLTTVMMLMARIRRVSLGELIRSNRLPR